MKQTIILIGGAPTAGKSSLATKLAKEMDVPFISTDTIRDRMRDAQDKDMMSYLHYFENTTAEEYLPNHSAEQIVDDQNKESEEVWAGISALIQNNNEFNSEVYIIEGIAILPHLVNKLSTQNILKPIFLINTNEKKINDIIYTRGLWDDADTYSDDLKKLELPWVLAFSDWIKNESEKYGYQVLDRKTTEPTTQDVRKLLDI